MPIPTLDDVKRAGPVAVVGFIAVIVVWHLTGMNKTVMAQLEQANDRIESMQTTWLQHLDREVFCPKEGK